MDYKEFNDLVMAALGDCFENTRGTKPARALRALLHGIFDSKAPSDVAIRAWIESSEREPHGGAMLCQRIRAAAQDIHPLRCRERPVSAEPAVLLKRPQYSGSQSVEGSEKSQVKTLAAQSFCLLNLNQYQEVARLGQPSEEEKVGNNSEVKRYSGLIVEDRSVDFDARGLPDTLKNENERQAWLKQVADVLLAKRLLKPDDLDSNPTTFVAILGMLLLDEVFDPQSSEFHNAVVKTWTEAMGSTPDPAKTIPNTDTYARVARVMNQILPKEGQDRNLSAKILLQELAYVSRYVISNAGSIPPSNPNFDQQIQIAMAQYVSATPTFASLELPPLSAADDVGDSEIVPENVRVFATHLAAYYLELMNLPKTVELVTESFLHGLVPVGYDEAGKALDSWYWSKSDRMNEAERWMIYSRMLGVTGGEVPKDVEPNTGFMDKFMRFLATIAEYDNQRRISNLFTGQTQGGLSLSSIMESVRQAGRAVAASATLYAYGYAHFSSRRLAADIRQQIAIRSQPRVQKAFGVNNAYQVIERVSIAQEGKAPDIPRLRTMADAAGKILDAVASFSSAWITASGKPLFSVSADAKSYCIPFDKAEDLIAQAQCFLAVSGVTNTQITKFSAPAATDYVASIPNLGGVSSSSAAAAASQPGLDKIKQMISQGQTPSLDQLKQFLPVGA